MIHTRRTLDIRRAEIDKMRGRIPQDIIQSLEKKLLEDENEFLREPQPQGLIAGFLGWWK